MRPGQIIDMKIGFHITINNILIGSLLFFRKCDVLNRGFSGYTTRSDKLILPRLLQNDNHPKGSVIAATILLGSNDSEDTCFDKSRNVPEKEYRENLKNICHQFNNAGVSFDRQVLITPPAVDDRKWEKHCKTKGFTFKLFFILFN